MAAVWKSRLLHFSGHIGEVLGKYFIPYKSPDPYITIARWVFIGLGGACASLEKYLNIFIF